MRDATIIVWSFVTVVGLTANASRHATAFAHRTVLRVGRQAVRSSTTLLLLAVLLNACDTAPAVTPTPSATASTQLAYAISFFSQRVPTKYDDIPFAQRLTTAAWALLQQRYPAGETPSSGSSSPSD